MRKKLLFLALVLFCANVMAEEQTNTWYAGTEFQGEINVFGLDWQCSGGTCILSGLYGQGLNMVVCQALSQKVGGLQYYYNESGMAWTKNKHSALLDQCNNPSK